MFDGKFQAELTPIWSGRAAPSSTNPSTYDEYNIGPSTHPPEPFVSVWWKYMYKGISSSKPGYCTVTVSCRYDGRPTQMESVGVGVCVCARTCACVRVCVCVFV
jgi:hypothetical protein